MKNAEHMAALWRSFVKAICFSLLFFTVSLSAQDSAAKAKLQRIQLHGYIKNMQTCLFTDKPGSLVSGNLVHNRLNFKFEISEFLSARVEMRNRIFFGEQVKLTPGFGKMVGADQGFFDLSHNIAEDTALVFNTLLDRLLVNWSYRNWDITLGRQRINWGINLVWNPNDIFNTFNYFDFDYQERPGTDALRMQYTNRKMSVFEFTGKISRKAAEQVAAMLYKWNYRKYDVQVFAGVYQRDIALGAGWAGNIRNTGFKGEMSYFHPYKNLRDTHGIAAISLSLDRSFKNDYFAMVSYLFNNKSQSPVNGILDLSGAILSARKLMPFRHSFFTQISKSFNPLLNGNLSLIFSPENHTLIVFPSFSFSVSENWDISLVSQSVFASVNSVYKTLGNGIFFRLQWSF